MSLREKWYGVWSRLRRRASGARSSRSISTPQTPRTLGTAIRSQIRSTKCSSHTILLPSPPQMIEWAAGKLMYQMLQKGEWQIADTCKKLIEAIPSRMHDERRPGDVLKVPGDPLDDVADDARYGICIFYAHSECVSIACSRD